MLWLGQLHFVPVIVHAGTKCSCTVSLLLVCTLVMWYVMAGVTVHYLLYSGPSLSVHTGDVVH